jgi:DNA-binding beta-propeller fold protein YncE
VQQNLPVVTSTQIALITNSGSNGRTSSDKVSRCDINPNTGELENCANASASSFGKPIGITLNVSGALPRVFVTSFDNDHIINCVLDQATGALSQCKVTNSEYVFENPGSATFNAKGTQVFVTNARDSSSEISYCSVETDGTFKNCQPQTVNGLAKPADILLNATDTKALVTNLSGNTVSRCDVDTSGNFTSCKETGGFNGPAGMSLYTTMDKQQTFLFVANSGLDHPNSKSTISRCPIEPDTFNLGDCINIDGGFINAHDIAFNAQGTKAYVTDSKISVCDVNTTTGDLNNCEFSGTGFDEPIFIVIYQVPLS